MNRRLALLLIIVFMVSVFASTSFAVSGSSDEWSKWYNSLSKEQQNLVNYDPTGKFQPPNLSLKDRQDLVNYTPKSNSNITTLSKYDSEWLAWFNALPKEKQDLVNYVPPAIFKLARENDLDKEFYKADTSADLSRSFKLEDSTKESLLQRAYMPTGGGELPYDPWFWNPRKEYANCYAYMLNVLSRVPYHKLQPGWISGHEFDSLTASDIISAVYRDMPVFRYFFRYSYYGERPGAREYKVALVIGPYDYHWYRQDRDGGWSHKQGLTEISYRDASGNFIYDPQVCNRNYGGGLDYPIFCGYFVLSY